MVRERSEEIREVIGRMGEKWDELNGMRAGKVCAAILKKVSKMD